MIFFRYSKFFLTQSNNGDTGPAATSWISVFMNLFVCAFGILGAISVKKILLKIVFSGKSLLFLFLFYSILFFSPCVVFYLQLCDGDSQCRTDHLFWRHESSM